MSATRKPLANQPRSPSRQVERRDTQSPLVTEVGDHEASEHSEIDNNPDRLLTISVRSDYLSYVEW
jgi:hypothetical protein